MKPNSSSVNKVLIIGSGIGGLTTAIILVKLGYDVTVIEKNSHPGGLTRSYTRNGIECATGVHYLGSLAKGQVLRKFFDYFEVTSKIPVERMGLNGIIDRYLFDTGFIKSGIFDFPEGCDAYEHNLKCMFPEEQKQISVIMKPIRQASEKLHSLDLLYSTENDLLSLDQYKPLGDILAQLNCSPGLKSVLGVPSCWIGVQPEECPAFYHNMALVSYLSSSWRLKCSGSHMANVFAQRLESLGGSIIQSNRVKEILVKSRVVKGVGLKSGRVLEAPLVIGAVHPQVVLDLLPDGAVKPSYRKRISKLRNTFGIFCVHAELDAAYHEEIPYNIFKVDTDRYGNIPDIKFYQIRNSEKKQKNLLSILTSGLTSGKSELWNKWEDSITGHRGTDYLKEKNKHAIRLVNEAQEILGSFNGLKIIDVYTPLTLRDWVNSPEGSAYGVLRSSRQLLATALLNRTSVKGLFIAGQNVVAPGIIGTIMGSFRTVKTIIGTEQFNKKVVVG
ncbi:MAG: NAD(P)/FAD-dependent oxidoreductase [Thermodesulfobacteriota bacterium]|nr:NAD(P)/FAD-dependent oxidoreductase [Thermodesulfobacteriota bacterium]